MSKKLTHLIAICLSFLMMATVLPNIRFGNTSIPVAYAEEISGKDLLESYLSYSSIEFDDENDYHNDSEAEDDLRFVDNIAQLFDQKNVTYEYNEDGMFRFVYKMVIQGNESERAARDEVTFDCMFEPNSMTFDFKITSLEYNEEMITDAVIDEHGGIDTVTDSDVFGEEYHIADYKDNTMLGDLTEYALSGEEGMPYTAEEDGIETYRLFKLPFLALLAIIVVVYVIVAESAEQIRARTNYSYNTQHETLPLGQYIENQHDGSVAGYKFGFTTFGGVGCEVAAVYNLMISLGRPERLSETIYKFEKWAIEFSVAWGNFGSNPRDIYRYLRKEKISYKRYTTSRYSSFCSTADGMSDGNFIFSRWNTPITRGLHTFYVEKNGDYLAYNNNDVLRATEMDAYLGGRSEAAFICGYIIKTART